MKNLVNKHVFCEWIHNEGYRQNWLRRISRQTKTQYIADTQRILLCHDKYKEKYLYKIFHSCANRMRMVDGKLVGRITHLSNPDGVNKITLIENFDILKCKYTFSELFERDLREILPADNRGLKYMIEDRNEWVKDTGKDFNSKPFLCSKVRG